MTRLLALVLAAFFPVAGVAADATDPATSPLIQSAEGRDLSEFLWINRLVVVFADTPADPRFQQQVEMLADGEAMLRDRDVIVLTDTDPAAKSPARTQLRPRGFQMTLVDKDGQVKLRKPSPWSVRELTRSIDKTQMRQQEVEERRVR